MDSHMNDDARLSVAVEALEKIEVEANQTRFIEVPRRNLDRCADIAATALRQIGSTEKGEGDE